MYANTTQNVAMGKGIQVCCRNQPSKHKIEKDIWSMWWNLSNKNMFQVQGIEKLGAFANDMQ